MFGLLLFKLYLCIKVYKHQVQNGEDFFYIIKQSLFRINLRLLITMISCLKAKEADFNYVHNFKLIFVFIILVKEMVF